MCLEKQELRNTPALQANANKKLAARVWFLRPQIEILHSPSKMFRARRPAGVQPMNHLWTTAGADVLQPSRLAGGPLPYNYARKQIACRL